MAKSNTVAAETIQRAASFYDAHRDQKSVSTTYGYFTHHPVAPLNKKRLILMLEAIESRSKALGRPLRVLDLACGGGLITCAVATLGHRALGLDLSHDEVHLAQQFALEEKLGGLFWQADLLADPFWEKTVEETLGGKPDVIILAYALHHLPQVEFFVDRVSRWLPEGATLLINEENPDSPLFRLKHIVRGWIQSDTEVEAHRTYAGWRELLDTCGFKTSPAVGCDLLPALGKLSALKCWSLVFTASKS